MYKCEKCGHTDVMNMDWPWSEDDVNYHHQICKDCRRKWMASKICKLAITDWRSDSEIGLKMWEMWIKGELP